MRPRSFIEKKKWPLGMNWKYSNDHFASLGLVNLTKILEEAVCKNAQLQLKLSFSGMEKPHQKAVCGKSARTV